MATWLQIISMCRPSFSSPFNTLYYFQDLVGEEADVLGGETFVNMTNVTQDLSGDMANVTKDVTKKKSREVVANLIKTKVKYVM